MSYMQQELPPITLSAGECDRLDRLATAAAARFPEAAAFLSREVERANVVDPSQMLPGLVKMNSEVQFRDDVTMKVRRVTLVYPNEADMDAGRISVLTPIGAALIGLSVNQSIEWQTPTGGLRSLTVLGVREVAV